MPRTLPAPLTIPEIEAMLALDPAQSNPRLDRALATVVLLHQINGGMQQQLAMTEQQKNVFVQAVAAQCKAAGGKMKLFKKDVERLAPNYNVNMQGDEYSFTFELIEPNGGIHIATQMPQAAPRPALRLVH